MVVMNSLPFPHLFSLDSFKNPENSPVFVIKPLTSPDSLAMDSPGRSFNMDKHLKEQFVSNLTGSSMLELFFLALGLPVLLLLRHSIGSKLGNTTSGSSSKKNDDSVVTLKDGRAYMVTIVLDFLCIVLPIIVCSTVLSDWVYQIVISVIVLLLLSLVSSRHGSSYYQEGGNSLRAYLTTFRVSTTIITCFCILAVDFKIFPRRYAKTETYGTSLMDLGVGAYVLTNSLVSRQARGVYSVIQFEQALMHHFTAQHTSSLMVASKLRSILLSTSPLLFLGFARVVFTTGVDYQVHVGEYGVHWNFFFTLAAVSILTSTINVPPSYCGVLGFLVLIGYQVCLMLGLNVYLLSATRGTDFISQNKEGIFSVFGYWGLYLVGVQLGNYLFFGKHLNARNNKWTRTRTWILFLVFWCLTLILDRHVERPSRRMCNLTYVTSVLASSLQILAIVMLSDFIPGNKLTLLEEAINHNLLGAFLVANVLTGLVNMSMNTLSVSSPTALIILILYMFFLSSLAGLAHFYNIRLKFW